MTRTILVAEDSALNRKMVVTMLERLGYQAELAQNGQEAVQSFCAHPYDAVLMDCQMPVMDGYQAAQALRAGGHQVPIIALTATDTPAERERCREAGMNDFLTKPITPDALANALGRWIAGV